MTFSVAVMLAAMSSSEAIVHLLNAPTSCGRDIYAEAREIVFRDAKAGKPLQQFVVGITTDDKALAEKCLQASRAKIREMAESSGNSMAWYLLSVEQNDITMLRKAADGGNVQALNALGSLIVSEAMSRRHGGTNELFVALQRGFRCFQNAARQKDANGFVNLGTCFLRGLGCRQDMKAAVSCYEAAAALGHPEAMDNLSAAYQFGHGVAADAEESLVWAMRGRALRGDRAAAKWLMARGRPSIVQ